MPLIVVHSHSHGDHTAGDAGFKNQPNVQFVAATVHELQKAFGIKTWPTDIVPIDLGGRIVDLIPIPGHDVAGIALYDRQTGILLTGDSFYPGRLYVGDAEFPTFVGQPRSGWWTSRTTSRWRTSSARTSSRRARRSSTTRAARCYQPDEHVLELTRGTLLELNDALTRLNGKLRARGAARRDSVAAGAAQLRAG